VTPARLRPLFTLDTVRLLLAPAMAFIATGLDRGYQTELWQHLARGRLIAREGAVVSVDRFTFTVPGRAVRDNNWLSQLLYYALHWLGGLGLVQLANSLTLAVTLALLVRLCRRASGSTRVAAVVGVGAFVGLWQTLLIRPQSFSMLLFVTLYGLLQRARMKSALLWLVPPLMALWANVHGGFAVGLALIAAFTAPAAWQRLIGSGPDSQRIWPLAACLLAAALATLLNPYGWDVYRYAGNLSALGVARGIEEWLPPSPSTLVGCAFAASVISVAVLVFQSRHRLTVEEVCILGCFLVPACLSVRMTVWWFLAAAPVAARLYGAPGLSAAESSPPDIGAAARPSPLAGAALASMLTVCLGSLPWLERYNPLLGTARPARRVEADLLELANALPGSDAPDTLRQPLRVFTRMEWANYLTWQLDGRTPVFVEGHVELYPAEVWDQYVTVNDARRGWRDVLDRYGVRFLLLDQTYHAALLLEVRRSDEWVRRSGAGPAVLFERRASVARVPGGVDVGVAGTDAAEVPGDADSPNFLPTR
jgi:hypothetical protein